MKPMHQMTPAELAAMGWGHGSFRDGIALAVLSPDFPHMLDEFRQECKDDRAEYIDLTKLPEFRK